MSLLSIVRACLVWLFTGLIAAFRPAAPEEVLEPRPIKSRYRLDDDSSSIVVLPDGRSFGYAQYGSLTGRPIFYHHGLPGSRLEAASYEEIALELGARIIAVDRPGIGWSSPFPSRTLLDLPKDLDFLAEHLGLDNYSVLGVSGGGPYALACAMASPRDKLKRVSIVCGLGPPDIGMSGAGLMNWIGFSFGFRYAPSWLGRWCLKQEPGARLDWSDEKRFHVQEQMHLRSKPTAHKKDFEIMTDESFIRLFHRSMRESYRQGYDAVLQDGKLMCLDFGFQIEDIRHDLPIQLLYGKHDRHVPLNHGEQIAARLGGRATLRVEDETHASIAQYWMREVLEGLMEDM